MQAQALHGYWKPFLYLFSRPPLPIQLLVTLAVTLVTLTLFLTFSQIHSPSKSPKRIVYPGVLTANMGLTLPTELSILLGLPTP